MEKFEKAWSQMVAKALSDQAFKARLLADPAAVLKEHGIAIPEGMTIKVLEDSAIMAHLILPEPPAELSEAELDQLAAGTLPIPLPLPRLNQYWSKVVTSPIAIPGGDTN
jgi:hypothetical protein